MASKQGMESDAATSTKLALIYSRLAELEIQKETKVTIWDDVCKRFNASDIDPAEITNMEVIFKDASQSLDTAALPLSLDSISESIDRIRILFLAEQQFADSLQASLQDKIKKTQAFQSERDGHASEAFRLREEMMKLEVRNENLEELCRNLQKLAKEKDTQRQQMVESEKLKSEHLEAECLQSIASVSKKIEQEEEELHQKELENASLREKLQEFKAHLNLRKEKRQNELRAQELQRRLHEARHAQATYLKEQDQLRRNSTKARIHQMGETVQSLRRQLSSYASKFTEFEITLERSAEVLDKISERQVTLSQIGERLNEEHRALKARAGEADVQVIQTIEQQRLLNSDISSMRAHYEKLEKKCRKLLLRRQELLKAPKTTASTTSTSSSSSSSSSSNSNSVSGTGGEKGSDCSMSTVSSSANISASAVKSSSYSSSSSSARVPGSMPTGRLKTPSPTNQHVSTAESAAPAVDIATTTGDDSSTSPISPSTK
jgi:myosin heavy subunit